MAGVPWGTVIAQLPALISAAGQLWRKTEQTPGSRPAAVIEGQSVNLTSLEKRIQFLEGLEPEQTRLLQQTMEQLQNLTLLASVTARRANIALGLAVVSVVVSVAGVVLG